MSLERLYKPQPGEKILLALRSHPIVFLRPIFIFGLAAIMPAVAAWLFFNGKFDFQNPLVAAGATLAAGTYYLCIWMFLFTQFVNYYLDVVIVTDRRIVEAVQDGLFSRSVSELDLARVQDVTSEVRGFVATMFNYGKVTVQTAGEVEHFAFEKIYNPHGVRERILELSHKDRKTEAKELFGETLRHDNL